MPLPAATADGGFTVRTQVLPAHECYGIFSAPARTRADLKQLICRRDDAARKRTEACERMEATARARILLVDADRLVLATLIQSLTRARFDAEGVDDARKALEICESTSPDIVVIDHDMPGFGGLRLAEALQRSSRSPFMFLSAHSDPDLVDRAATVGALAYVVKPVESRQLIAAISTALKRGREMVALRQELERVNSALSGSRDISVVTGVLMERYGLGQSTAYDKLRNYARGQRRRLVEVAAEILSDADRLRSTLQRVMQGVTEDRNG